MAATGGWDSLINVYRLATLDQQAHDAEPPVACPNDGEPLAIDPDDQLRCPWCGWIWDGQPIRY